MKVMDEVIEFIEMYKKNDGQIEGRKYVKGHQIKPKWQKLTQTLDTFKNSLDEKYRKHYSQQK